MSAPGAWWVWNRFTSLHVALYRGSGGRVGGTYSGAPVLLLLHHQGRRSGRERISPLIYVRDGADLVVVASKGGSHRHPMWWPPYADYQARSSRDIPVIRLSPA